MRATIVTMDSHLAGAMLHARGDLHREIPGLELSIHAAQVAIATRTRALNPHGFEPQLAQTDMLDPEMRGRLAKLNPTASTRIASRLIEAHERQSWTPSDETIEALRQAGEELEDRLKGIGVEMAA